MSPTVSLIIDLVMVGLLAATIAYAIILNKQIIKLRESRGEMTELIKGLNEAMAKAETGVRGLKKTAHDTGEDLQRTVNKAQTLRDELEFMIEAADALANRLGSVGDNRPKPATAARPAPKPALSARPAVAPRPLAQHQDGDHDEDDDHEPLPPPLRAEASRRPVPQPEPREPMPRDGESLSRAERELLQAIENAGKGMG